MDDRFYKEHVYLLITRENKDSLLDIENFIWFSEYSEENKLQFEGDIGRFSTDIHTFHFRYHNNVTIDNGIQWISVKDKLPNIEKGTRIKVVIIDAEIGSRPLLGWYDNDEPGGFYLDNSLVRVVCSHYIEVPKNLMLNNKD